MAAAVVATIPPPPPPRSGNNLSSTTQQPPWKSNAVNRSNEFLSAARTALKIAQQQHLNRQQQELNGGGGYNSTNNNNSNNNDTLPEWMVNISPANLNLYQPPPPSYNNNNQLHSSQEEEDDTISLIQDSQTLLKLLDTHLSELHTLVRRRGHTNDPTLEIQSTIEKFQESAKEIKHVCDHLRLAGTKPCNCNIITNGSKSKRSSTQRRKHYELVSQQLESQAKERTDSLKKELETRSKVLRDQTQRRKLLASGGAAGGSGINGGGGGMTNNFVTHRGQPTIATATRLPTISQTKKASQFQSPLFTSTQPGGVAASAAAGSGSRNKNNPTSNAYSGYAGYGGSSSTTMASYGGTTTSAPSSFGMRQRKQQQPTTTTKSHIQIDSGNDDSDDKYTKNGNNNESTTIQQQIQLRRENRATKNRAAQARLAERSIAELGVMFTKMSSLISQQGEVLERIEDDVETAGLDIDAGHDELVKVYGMTKGNRGLILKVFGILIFLIIFMKLY